VYDIHGKPLPNLYLYYDGSTEYFGREHLPFGITACLVLLIFIIFTFPASVSVSMSLLPEKPK